MAKKRERKRKQRERRLRQAAERIRNKERPRGTSLAGLKPYEPVKMRLYKAPELFTESVSQEERRSIIRDLGIKAEEVFQEEYSTISKWFETYDPLYILSFSAVYFLSNPEGIDPEVKGYLDFYPHYLEILQAFALMQPRAEVLEPLGQKASDLQDHMQKIGEAMVLRSLGIDEDLSDQEIHQRVLLTDIRNETAAVRNWGYSLHMRKVTQDLAHSVRSEFAKRHGVDPVRFMNTLEALGQLAEDRLNEHLRKTRNFFSQKDHKAVMAAYHSSFPDTVTYDEAQVEQLFDSVGRRLSTLKGLLVTHSDLRLRDYFTFDLGDIMGSYGPDADEDSLRGIFDGLSLEFGALKGQNKEHVILDNPVWHKPFIKVGPDTYFSSIAGLFQHYSLPLLEGLVSADESLRKTYLQRKARYLEDELEKLMKASFPKAAVYRGSQWKSASGEEGENDLTVIVDCMALVVEAKSGLITPPARRGARDRFRRTIKELVELPAGQALSFIELLKFEPGPHSFETRRGEVNVIDSSRIRHYIPLTVTLEQFGSLGNLRTLVEAGITNKSIAELAPVISLTDLMVIFEVLELQSEKIHYLGRRREFNSRVSFHGDELDVLAFYLDHAFNIGEAEYSGEHHLMLGLSSKQLDPYFVGKDSGVDVAKPTLAKTDSWAAMLTRLDEGNAEHWLDQALILLNVPAEDQGKFQRQWEKLAARVRRGRTEQPHNWVVLLAGPPQRRFFIAVYPFLKIDRQTRNAILSEILDAPEARRARGALAVGIDLEHKGMPYAVTALKELPKIFDDP